MEIHELDVVRLTDGRKGTVVHAYADGTAFEVEFLDNEGYTTSLETVEADVVQSVTWRCPPYRNETHDNDSH